MITKTSQGGSIIILSIMCSYVLIFIPLSEPLRFLRPEFVVLTLMYWTMVTPEKVSIGVAWLVGLLMDVMLGGDLGLLAFSYAFIVYLVLIFHRQLRHYPVWQQAGSAFILVLLLKIILMMMTTDHSVNGSFWWPAATSMVVWPLVSMLLRGLKDYFDVR